MLISKGCCNKLLEAECLKTPKIYIFSQFWSPEVWNQGVSRTALFPEALGESIPGLLQFLRAPGRPWFVAHTPTSASMVTLLPLLSQNSFCLSLIRIHLIEFRAHQDKLLLSRSLINILLYKVIVTGSKDEADINRYFRRPLFNPLILIKHLINSNTDFFILPLSLLEV